MPSSPHHSNNKSTIYEGDVTSTITIYAIPGSQFTGKVLAALDSRSIPHYCEFVPIDLNQRRKIIPSGGTMVPEMKVITTSRTGGEEQQQERRKIDIVPDSEAILHWIDDNYHNGQQDDDDDDDSKKFFPPSSKDQASELSLRASTGMLAGCVYYFNWVDEEGYNCSMKKSIARSMVPSFVPTILSEMLVDLFLPSTKAKFKKLCMEATNIEDETTLNDRDQIKSMLIDELKFYQNLLLQTNDADDDTQAYLLGKNSTAIDFSVYVQVERLVGDMGDAQIEPSIPLLKKETSKELSRFWKWHDMMRMNHPLKFKGKRPPPSKTPQKVSKL